MHCIGISLNIAPSHFFPSQWRADEVHSTAQDSVITLFMSFITCSAGHEQSLHSREKKKKKLTMKIDAVYLWLYNVAVLIGVWNKHRAFRKGYHRYSRASAVWGTTMESVWLLWCWHRIVVRIFILLFFPEFVLEGLHLTFNIRCRYAVQEIRYKKNQIEHLVVK